MTMRPVPHFEKLTNFREVGGLRAADGRTLKAGLLYRSAGHELDAAARRDRAAWLGRRLRLKHVDIRALDAIPALH